MSYLKFDTAGESFWQEHHGVKTRSKHAWQVGIE
jgi:hypothetical protein